MIKSIVLLLAIFSCTYSNPHNIANIGTPNLILPQRNIQQLIPQLTQWEPTRISSYGVRFDQFVRYLNVPIIATTPLNAINLPVRGFTEEIPIGVQFAVPLNILPSNNEVKLSSPQAIPNPAQQSSSSVPLQTRPQQSTNIPFSVNPQLTNHMGSQYITPFATPTKATTTNTVQSNVNTPTGVTFSSPSNDQNFGQSLGPMFIQTSKAPANNNGQNFPLNTFSPGTFNTPIMPNLVPNTVQSNVNTPTGVTFSSPSNDQNFGQSLGPMFIQTSKAPANNNGQNFPLNTFSPDTFNTPIMPNLVPNPVTVPKLYQTPLRGSDSVQNTNSYSSPAIVPGTTQPEQKITETTRQSPLPSSNDIHSVNNIPLRLPYH